MGYYYISIGGSGAKVMESLTHLCAAGLLPNKEKEEDLYVMSIDPDVGNGNLNRSSAALHNFTGFQEAVVGKNTPLLKTRVEIASPFPWSPVEHDKRLDDIMAYHSHKGDGVSELYEALYTEAERNTFLNEGFRGRPSIGAAVLAKKAALFNSKQGWTDTAEAPWNKFARLVKDDAKSGRVAKIFLAGSVFGGTGAAGMPTVARLLRDEFESYCEDGKVVIGGALILPYFSFTPTKTDDGQIFASSGNFLTNTKAALKYYFLQSKNDKIYDSMYFVGDNVLSPVANFSVGAATQTNDAHIVDLYGAMAAVDFYAAKPDKLKKCTYISRNQEEAFTWKDFPDITMDDGEKVSVKSRLAQHIRFIFSYLYLVKPVLKDLANGNKPDYQYPWYVDYLRNVDVNSDEVKQFGDYAESFVQWLSQIEGCEVVTDRREVQFVDKQSFSINSQRKMAQIDPKRFEKCIIDAGDTLSLHEIWTNLAERPIKEDGDSRGFGRFLRALYDSCATVKTEKK